MPVTPPQPASAESVDRGLAVGLALLLTGVTWQLGGSPASTMAWALPVQWGLVAVAMVRWWVWHPTGAPPGWWWPLPMLGWTWLHVRGLSPAPDLAWLDAMNWWWLAGAWMLAGYLTRRPVARMILGGTLVGCMLIAVGAACYQRWVDPAWLPLGRTAAHQYAGRSTGVFGGPNNFAAWLALLLPAALARGFGAIGARSAASRWPARLVAVALALGLALSLSRGVWLALGGALLAWPLMVARWPWWRRLGALVVVLLVLSCLFIIAYRQVPLVQERIDHLIENQGERTRPAMWAAAARLWWEQPWVGSGGGAFPLLIERYRPPWFWDVPRWVHSDYLNTLSDYGVVGFALSFGLFGVGVNRILRLRRRARAGSEGEGKELTVPLAVGLLAFGGATLIDFHLKVPAVSLAAIWVGAEWLRRVGPPPVPQESAGTVWPGLRRLAVGMIVLGLGLLMVDARTRYTAESLRWHARRDLNGLAGIREAAAIEQVAEPAIQELRQAVSLDARNRASWSDLAMALALRDHYATADKIAMGQEAEAAARRALAISPVGYESWLRLGVAQDLQGEWVEAGASFNEALRLAPNSHVAWYYKAFHYQLRPTGKALARGALAICLRLDPWYPDANALRIELEVSNR